MVGTGDDDHCRIWRCDAKDFLWDVRGSALRSRWRTNDCVARSRHCQQFLKILLSQPSKPLQTIKYCKCALVVVKLSLYSNYKYKMLLMILPPSSRALPAAGG